MEGLAAPRTLGVVVLHEPGGAVDELPAVRDLLPQVDRLLLVCNGRASEPGLGGLGGADGKVEVRTFPANRGTAAAWNAALAFACDNEYRYLYLLDQDSIPSRTAVSAARSQLVEGGLAAVVQPPSPDRLNVVRFPWDTVASGSMYEVDALRQVGGFDERLFVDEVDHELLDRLVRAGYRAAPLPAPSVDHEVGSPREVRILGRSARALGHGRQRNKLRGYSTGLLMRRYVRLAPRTSIGLLVREVVLAAKEVAGGEAATARALLGGLAGGLATTAPPAGAAERECPYCEGPLLGRFAEVPDWRFGAGPPADVYRCAGCGALAAGRVPTSEELATWYSEYYTHAVEPEETRAWSRFWPRPKRRREQARLRSFLTSPATTGRFLEVGTGSGERLVEFAKAGWEVVGQDPDPRAGHLARDQGIDVHDCPVSDLVGREKPFDLIGLGHVLEHVPDPARLLRDCAALLAPEGRICVISPNADALGRLLFGRWWFGLEQPRHLAIPTLESLRRVTSRVPLGAVHAESTAANAAVILGGSLARVVEARLPPGRLRRAAAFGMHFLGQALGRAAVVVARGRGEEVVWVARRLEP